MAHYFMGQKSFYYVCVCVRERERERVRLKPAISSPYPVYLNLSVVATPAGGGRCPVRVEVIHLQALSYEDDK